MVMVIIVLLAAMISPAINWTIKLALAAKGQTRIDRLKNGLVVYKSEWRKYPGQDILANIGPDAGSGQYTGSQILAAAMYDYVYTEIATQTEVELDPQSKYAEYFRHQTDTEHEDNSLFTFDAAGANERKCTLSDGFWTEKMPICYYVSVPGVYSTIPAPGNFLTQFRYSHNSTYTDAAIDFPAFLGLSQGEVDGLSAAALAAECQSALESWVAHTQFPGRPYNDGGFLLISAGPDRTWFTDDDGKNWTTGD